MSEYTPTTEEVETHWTDVGFAGDRESFRRWLAEVERSAAYKALTDAAEVVDRESTVWVADEASPRGGAYWDTNDWLRARAEAYRREETT